MPIAARDATDRVEQLTILTERLTAMLETEISLLKERRPGDITSHAAERNKLSAVYTQEMALIGKDRSLIASAKPAVLATFKTMTARFREVLAAHDRLLSAMRTVSEGMLKSVAEQAHEKTRTVTGYGKNAALRATQTAKPAALALNQVV